MGAATNSYSNNVMCNYLIFPSVIIRANIYLFKVNNRNSSKRCEIYSKLTVKIPERQHCDYDL